MKTISQHLDDRDAERRHQRIRRNAATMAAVAMAVLIGCIVAATVVKTARIVADDMARCDGRGPVCMGPEW